ncbi:hypothetical protein F2Q68_00008778 [Brassica cretica]|uniref:Uncharacterized protein n=1 Tax=Brassica cretica TaxID=69181 RepID=A0A8S9KUK7_BRACR|nr:hypothetical protein F2Q68_00008778 [Brassica cretica]
MLCHVSVCLFQSNIPTRPGLDPSPVTARSVDTISLPDNQTSLLRPDDLSVAAVSLPASSIRESTPLENEPPELSSPPMNLRTRDPSDGKRDSFNDITE